jgi:hypothetical protein
MRKEREALLIAALAGLVIVGAAAFVVQPSVMAKPAPMQPSIAAIAAAAPAVRLG